MRLFFLIQSHRVLVFFMYDWEFATNLYHFFMFTYVASLKLISLHVFCILLHLISLFLRTLLILFCTHIHNLFYMYMVSNGGNLTSSFALNAVFLAYSRNILSLHLKAFNVVLLLFNWFLDSYSLQN